MSEINKVSKKIMEKQKELNDLIREAVRLGGEIEARVVSERNMIVSGKGPISQVSIRVMQEV